MASILCAPRNVKKDARKRHVRRAFPWKLAALCALLGILPWTTLRARSQDAANTQSLGATGEVHTADTRPCRARLYA